MVLAMRSRYEVEWHVTGGYGAGKNWEELVKPQGYADKQAFVECISKH
jgi:hypothetical protein